MVINGTDTCRLMFRVDILCPEYKITANDTHSLTSLEKEAFKEALKEHSKIRLIKKKNQQMLQILKIYQI